MNTLQKTKLVTVALWATTFLWLVLIFVLSAQPADQSSGVSRKVAETIIGTIAWIVHVDIDAKTISSLAVGFNHLVRKFAHAGIYFVLGGFIIMPLIKTGIRGSRAYVLTILFCLFYAVTDEIHQTFIPGRSGQISDVLLDTAGAMIGSGTYWLYVQYLRNKN